METLRAAFDDSFVAQLIVSKTGQIIEANHQACQALNHTREELLRLSHNDLVVSDDLEMFIDTIDKFESGRTQNYRIELRYLRSDRKFLWASVSVSAVRKEGRMTALLLQLQDISEQKRAEAALQQNNHDLEQFVYIASHDLREPLTAIAGFSTLLKRRYSGHLNEEGNKFLQEIVETTKRMETKIDDLLAFSRAGRMPTSKEATFPLGLAIEEARRSLVRSIEEAHVIFTIPSDLPTVYGDRSLIAQVFQNLFSNSIKYRNLDTPRIVVTVNPGEDNCCIVSVQDNGIGFDMRHKDRIFGVFQRLYTIEQYPGTGIGLAIAKKIVERHQGRIWPESAPGKGSTFFFTLPVATQS